MSKVKRQRINWVNVLGSLDSDVLNRKFFALVSKLHGGKHISCNRAAYCVLKSHYSTTTISELVRKVGL